MLHAGSLLALLAFALLALMLHAGSLLALLAFALLALVLLGSSLGLAVVTLLVGGLGAGLTVLVVLALVLLGFYYLRAFNTSGDVHARGILGQQGPGLHAVGLVSNGFYSILSHQ